MISSIYIPIDEAFRKYPVLTAARDSVSEITRRSGVSAWYDRRGKRFAFGYKGEVLPRIVDSFKAFRPGGAVARFDPLLDPLSVDDFVHTIMQARKTGQSTKEIWAMHAAENRKRDDAEALGQYVEEGTGEIEDRLEYSRKRRQMGKHYTGSALVQGTKQGTQS